MRGVAEHHDPARDIAGQWFHQFVHVVPQHPVGRCGGDQCGYRSVPGTEPPPHLDVFVRESEALGKIGDREPVDAVPGQGHPPEFQAATPGAAAGFGAAVTPLGDSPPDAVPAVDRRGHPRPARAPDPAERAVRRDHQVTVDGPFTVLGPIGHLGAVRGVRDVDGVGAGVQRLRRHGGTQRTVQVGTWQDDE